MFIARLHVFDNNTPELKTALFSASYQKVYDIDISYYGTFNFDYLVKVVSVRSIHCKITPSSFNK